MLNDLANDIFGDTVEAYHALGNQGDVPAGGDSVTNTQVDDTKDSNTQDVDSNKGQGGEDKSAPVTPDESADQKDKAEDQEPDVTDKGKNKVDGAKSARQWGEQWKQTAEQHEAKIKEYEKQIEDAKPLLDAIEEKFGGKNNLELASEVYGALANQDGFDPANAMGFLAENFPDAAQKLSSYIGNELIQRATETAISRTFGRQLDSNEIKSIRDFLAAGKPANSQAMESFFKSDDIPDELKVDAEGKPLPAHVVDFMRRQAGTLKETQAQIDALKNSVDGAKAEQKQVAVAEAIESYTQDTLSPLGKKMESLGLLTAVEGETPELKEFREECAGLLDAYTLYLANQDSTFKTVYAKAMRAVRDYSADPRNKVAKATADDLSLRIQAMIGTFAGRAAKMISPLVDSISTKRGDQVKKVNETRPDVDAPTSDRKSENTDRQINTSDDPFADVNAVVHDKIRRGEIRVR